MYRALLDNYESLALDQDKKATIKQFYDVSWKFAIDNFTKTAVKNCSDEIMQNEEKILQFQKLQTIVISLKDQARVTRDLCFHNADLTSLFQNASQEVLMLLDQPPIFFMVIYEKFKNFSN